MRRIRVSLHDRRVSCRRALVTPLDTTRLAGAASVAPRRDGLTSQSTRAFASMGIRITSDDEGSRSHAEPRLPFFDPDRSESEWRETTQRLLHLDSSSFTPREIVWAEQAIRYWTTQKSTEAIDFCFQLLDVVTKQLQLNSDLLTSGDLSYFYSGNYPRATHLLNAVVDTWRIQFELQDTKRTQQSPARLLNTYQVLDKVDHYASLGVPLNCRTYSIIMQASLCDHHYHKDTPLFCEQLLNRMLQQPQTMPDTVAFTTAINAWSKSKRPEAALRAEKLFQELTQLYDNNLLEEPPNTVTYNTVLDAMRRSKQPDVMQRAQQLFDDMRTSPYPHVSPTTVSYRILMDGWASIQRMDQACALLQDMVQVHQAGSTDVQVDATFFSQLISVLAKTKERRNHERARELYQVLKRLHQETQDALFNPDELFTSRAMIIVYSKLQQPDLAEALLQRLEKQALRHEDTSQRAMLLPKRGHYRDVLFAWTKSQRRDAAERAERVLMRMIHVLDAEPALVDKFTVDCVLQQWSRQSIQGQASAAQRGELLLRQLESINNDKGVAIAKMGRSSYQHVMKGWALSGDAKAPEQVERLLMELNSQGKKNLSMMPTRMHYTVAATAWVKSKRDEASERIRHLIEQAHKAYKLGQNDVVPDRVLYGILIHSCAQKGDAAGAEGAWNEMMDQLALGNKLAMPTIAECNLVLLAYLRSKDEGQICLRRIERLLVTLDQLELSPDNRTKNLLDEAESKRRSNSA